MSLDNSMPDRCMKLVEQRIASLKIQLDALEDTQEVERLLLQVKLTTLSKCEEDIKQVHEKYVKAVVEACGGGVPGNISLLCLLTYPLIYER